MTQVPSPALSGQWCKTKKARPWGLPSQWVLGHHLRRAGTLDVAKGIAGRCEPVPWPAQGCAPTAPVPLLLGTGRDSLCCCSHPVPSTLEPPPFIQASGHPQGRAQSGGLQCGLQTREGGPSLGQGPGAQHDRTLKLTSCLWTPPREVRSYHLDWTPPRPTFREAPGDTELALIVEGRVPKPPELAGHVFL